MSKRKSFLILVNISLILLALMVTGSQRAEATWHYILNEDFGGEWGQWPWSIAGNQWNVLPYG